ncbi:MAG: hypothetical protein Q9M89_03935 [Persephonella sp.]|nr:hypothetical protein [Persephonella sp.]
MFKIAVLMFIIFIVACSPKYRVEKIYHPPSDKNCLRECDREFTQCQDSCQKNYHKCLQESIDRAKKIYIQLEDEYQINLNRYYRKYDGYLKELEAYNKQLSTYRKDYQFYSKICSQYKDKEACQRRDYLKKKIKSIESQKPVPPQKPSKVDFETVLKRKDRHAPATVDVRSCMMPVIRDVEAELR